jgi:hypothetical protein
VPFYVQRLPGHFAALDATYKRCWFPRRCGYSGKFLWLRKAYRLETHDYDFQEDIVRVYCWIDKDVYLIMKIKGEL